MQKQQNLFANEPPPVTDTSPRSAVASVRPTSRPSKAPATPTDEPYFVPGAQQITPELGNLVLSPPSYPLDPQQDMAANHKHGPALVVAGAGSGKTTVIIEQAARRLAAGMSPVGYVMLTFSRKSAMEMRSRLTSRLSFDPGINPTTFHSFCLQMMRKAPSRFGLPNDITVMDDRDQKKLFDFVLNNNGVERKVYPSSQFQRGYSFCKNACLRAGTSIEAMQQIVSHMHEFLKPQEQTSDPEISDEQIVSILFDYEMLCQAQGLLDYDDLILKPVETFDALPDIARQYSTKISSLVVDESQDTNLAQYRLVVHLASVCKNVVMVGDDDQSIYGWRGAHPENMRKFMDDFGAREYLIERNYRSAPDIVSCATKQIRLNTDRLEKNPVAASTGQFSGEVALTLSKNNYDMCDRLIYNINQAIENNISPNDIAVLYRSNRMLLEVESSLINARIPYHVAGTAKLFDRREVRMFVSFARLAVNPKDVGALWQVAKLLPGVGDETVAKLTAFSEKTDKTPLSNAALQFINQTKAASSLLHLRETLQNLRDATPLEWVDIVRNRHDVMSLFKKELENNPATYRRREANINLLDDWAQSLSCHDWRQFFDILLEQDDPHPDKQKPVVTLSTIHKAKGLEWDHVHFVGFSKGLFPMEARDEEDIESRNPEEERRLCYVATTRAKRFINFYHSNCYQLGRDRQFPVSPFASEMIFHHVHRTYKANLQEKQNHRAESPKPQPGTVIPGGTRI